MAYLKVTQKEIKQRIKSGELVDITYRSKDLPKGNIIAVSRGSYGMNGAIIRGHNGRMYGISARTSNLDRYI